MLFKSIALAAVFLASASNAFDLHRREANLEERAGGYGPPAAADRGGPPAAVVGAKGGPNYKFAPGIQTATGDTCGAAFGNGYTTCREAAGDKNRLCYNPDAGQKCCSKSWSCPNGSFCLGDGVCCPDGMDPASCGAAAVASSVAAAALTSSTAAPTSSAPAYSTSQVQKSVSSVVTSAKVVPTSFAPLSSSKPVIASSPASVEVEEAAPAQATVNAARRESLGAAGLVGAGLVAFLAAY